MRWFKFVKKEETSWGQVIVAVLVFGTLGAFLISGLASWGGNNILASRRTFYGELTFQVAEAGVEYYRWHLAHAPEDYQDDTGEPGPYIHDFYDKDGNMVGQFTLEITPPSIGSSVVVVRSTGKVNVAPGVSRTLEVRLAIPSLAKYAVVANNIMRFGGGTEVFGPIHSNNGIRFDGLAHNVVSSAVEKYNDPDHSGPNEFGVHTHLSPLDPYPPEPVPDRLDVFEAGRQFPLPAVDFGGITADLARMKDDAQADGFYRPSAGALGYHIVLKTNDTFDLFRTTSFTRSPWGCSNVLGQDGWSTWSINREQLIGNYPFPNNGLIFLEDDIFVDGQIDGARLTIVAAFFPDSPPFRKNIIVNNDLLYTNYNGQDVMALIAQGNVNVGMVSEDDLRIDAALVAQNGRVGRHYYRPPCSPYHQRQTITTFGMIATNQRYGFAYTDGTGYQIRNLQYDANLLYGPPPSFPLTSDQYSTLAWEEVD